ncbi:hypothetical protein DOY81_011258 [Sarcophaga bullata]|nr:hypothetical protein DOY81_011258 [Sarcophaga bullata]
MGAASEYDTNHKHNNADAKTPPKIFFCVIIIIVVLLLITLAFYISCFSCPCLG